MFLYISVHLLLFLLLLFDLFSILFVCLFVWFVGSSILSTLRLADVVFATDVNLK